MTEIPIVVSTNEVTVAGFVDQVQLELDVGQRGQRGSRIFSGPSSPLSLPADSPYWGGYTQFVLGDLFIVTQSTGIGDVYEYINPPGGPPWVKIISRFGVRWYEGTGTPNGNITAIPGSLYTNLSGGAGTTLYVKESGTGNTGWVGK